MESQQLIIRLIIKPLAGQEFTLDVVSNITIDELTSEIAEKTNYPKEYVKLIYRGQIINGNYNSKKTLLDCGLCNNATIHYVKRGPPTIEIYQSEYRQLITENNLLKQELELLKKEISELKNDKNK